MANTRKAISGRRGWTAVVGLSTVLTVLVVGQLPAASADRPLSPVAEALGVIVPSLAPTAAPSIAPELRRVTAPVPAIRTVTTSAADRLAGPIRATALRVPPKPKPAPVKAAATPVRASVAKPAAAAVPGLCSGDGWQARRGQAALDSLRPGAAARTGFRIEFKGARSGYMGLTHLNERRIEMFVRACGTQSDELLRHVMAHELGHAYDTVRNNAAIRAAWQAARGIPAATPWYGCSGCTDFATPAGDFAEVYAQWARGASSNRSQLAGDVPPAQLAALAARFFGA